MGLWRCATAKFCSARPDLHDRHAQLQKSWWKQCNEPTQWITTHRREYRCSSSEHPALEKKAVIPIHKVLAAPCLEWNSRPTSVEAGFKSVNWFLNVKIERRTHDGFQNPLHKSCYVFNALVCNRQRVVWENNSWPCFFVIRTFCLRLYTSSS